MKSEVATAAPTTTGELGELLGRMGEIAARSGRQDLVARLDGARTKVTDPRLRIVVVGPLKQGKSQFVNSLLGIDVCSVGDDETTAVPTLAAYADEASAHLVLDRPGSEPERVTVPLDQINAITPDHPLAGGSTVLRLEVNVPSPLLADGLVLVDTPGVGGHGNPHAASTLGLLPAADAVFVVSDASQEFTEPEVAFLKQVVGLCPTVACLITKTDLYPHWRAIVEADRAHLRREGVDVPLLPVSSLLRSHALRLKDDSLNAEAGFVEVYQFLRDRVVARAAESTKASVALDLRSVSEHLALTLGSELAALRNPEKAAAAVAELQRAKATADEMKKRTALWQQTLSDGITDLAADIDHDLRDRLRAVTREAEDAVDQGDPGKDWAQLGEWLEDQIAVVVGDNFVWAHERAIWLSERIAEHFADSAQAHLPALDITDIDGVFDTVTELSELESGRVGITQKVLIGMRGSYGGVLMFGLIGTFAGLALINPISVGAGLLLGTKAYKDDKEARTVDRRQKAKAAIRKFTDDVSFQVGKESKDRLRHVHRALRDHFTEIAEQSARSIGDSLQAAQEGAALATSEQRQRTAQLEGELKAVAALRKLALQLDSAGSQTAVSRAGQS
ncbi:dynamin family protein [Williamsia limnetica]|uniref:Dynamin family protein n=1 Tax=Williamsia limnetica TaxID=882452 RepID=A0A318RDD5_WILLI|nr:dynamin family protein [Williamsia limnetica]PYE11889.1 dynamin family protein [Williamsia limnetica]